MRHLFAGVLDAARSLDKAQGEHPAWKLLAHLGEAIDLFSRDWPVHLLFQQFCEDVERVLSPAICTVSLIKKGRLHLRAAPSLPLDFRVAIDGTEIGPAGGSCAAAAHRREAIYSHDISVDGRWSTYRTEALKHGLRACWSQPLLTDQGDAVGTIAVYWKCAKYPSVQEKLLLITFAMLARAILVHSKRIQRLESLEAALQESQGAILTTDNQLKAMQAFLHHTLQDFDIALSERDAMGDKLSVAEASKREIERIVTSDVQTPLQAIVNLTNTILSEEYGPLGDKRYYRCIKKINNRANFLLEFLTGLASPPISSAGAKKLIERRVDLRRLCAICGRLVNELLAARQLKFRSDIDPTISKAWLDGPEIKRALLQILNTAIEVSPQGGKITMQAKNEANGDIKISVESSISSTSLRAKAEAFVQKETRRGTSRRDNFKTAEAIANAHGGALTIESHGRRRTVALVLPRNRILLDRNWVSL